MPNVEDGPLAAEAPETGTSHIAARERTVPRSSAAYVYAGGKGEAAYKLIRIIEGHDKRFSERADKSSTGFRWKLIAGSSTDQGLRREILAKPSGLKWKLFASSPKKKTA
jgi:hypothetical protein